MDLKTLSQLFSVRDIRNAILGAIVIFGGIGLAGLTYYAHRTQQPRLAGISAGISLVFVLLILIFIVPPLAKNAGKEASQMNLPFEFTAGGAMILGLLAIVGFSAWNTGNNLLFLVLSFLAAAMIVSFFAGALTLKKLDVKMRFPETIFAGEETPILVSLVNRKRVFGSYSIVAEVRGKEKERSLAAEDLRKLLPRRIADRLSKAPLVRRTLDYFVFIPRRGNSDSQSNHVFPARGRFVISDFELSTKFPFGFFRHRRRLAAKETELVVFPTLAPLEHRLDDLPLEAGKLVANKRGSGQDLLALRDYQPNDDLRRIDWKATARSRHLIVREFSAEDDKKITVVLDARLPEESRPKLTLREKLDADHAGGAAVSQRFEKAVSLAASLLSHFTEEQAEVRLIIDGDASEFGVGSRHLHELLRRLAVVEPQFTEILLASEIEEKLSNPLGESENSHNFLITALAPDQFSTELGEKVNFVGY